MSTDNYEDTIVRRGVKRELPCKLTEEEFTRIARQRATKEAERDQLEMDLAHESKKRKDQIKEYADEIGKMGRELRTGEQDRTVNCDEVFRKIDGTGWIVVVRKDTWDEVERRPASAHETQRYLPGVDGPSAAQSDQAVAVSRERSAQPEGDGSDVPTDEDVPPDEDKAPAEKFDVTLLAEGKCALRFEGGAACTLDVGHAGLHVSSEHKWKARRPKPDVAVPSLLEQSEQAQDAARETPR